MLNRSWLSLFGSGVFLFYLLITVYFQNEMGQDSVIESFLRKMHKFSLIAAGIGIAEKLASLFSDMTWISEIFWSPTYIPNKEAYRIYATFGNPNVAGDWFALLALVSVYFLEQSTYKKKGFYAITMGIFITALLFTGSKGSIIGLIGGLIVFAIFSQKRKTKWVVGFTILAIVAAGLLLPELNRPSNYRNAIWLKSLMLYKHHPMFGVGLIGIYDRIGEIHSHNVWISLLGMLGIGGFGLYLGMKLYLYNCLLKLKAVGCRLLPLLGAVQALVVAHGTVDFTLMTPQGGVMFIAASGIICGLVRPYEQYKSIPLKVPSIPSYNKLPSSYELYQKIKAESHH